MPQKKEPPQNQKSVDWFYYASILAAYLFTVFISVYAAIHFEDIRYMNYGFVFLFLSLALFFLISWTYFYTERLGRHKIAPVIFFAGIVGIIFYAYRAVDASNIVRYSIIYTIIVTGISLFILLFRKTNQG